MIDIVDNEFGTFTPSRFVYDNNIWYLSIIFTATNNCQTINCSSLIICCNSCIEYCSRSSRNSYIWSYIVCRTRILKGNRSYLTSRNVCNTICTTSAINSNYWCCCISRSSICNFNFLNITLLYKLLICTASFCSCWRNNRNTINRNCNCSICLLYTSPSPRD